MKPLEGILVVAIEQAAAAPLCTARLVAAGARVIKIEREEGDFARNYDTAAKGESSYFTWLNQGKESVCLNFKQKSGETLLKSLLARADVLVQNLSPGALARSGFSTEHIHSINPKLIVCNISGYNPNSEDATRAAYDLLIQAESGLINVSGSPESAGRIGVSICDIGTGMTAYSSILEALLCRDRTDKGKVIDVSLFDVAAEWMTVPYIHAQYGAGPPAPAGLKHPSIAPYGAFECKDKRSVLIAVQNEREWQRFGVQVLNTPTLCEDERFTTNNLRVENLSELEAEIGQITATLDAAEFMTRLKQARIGYGAMTSLTDLGTHSAISMQDYRTAANKVVTLPAIPVSWAHDDDAKLRSPKIGEHTDLVTQEFTK